MNWFEIVHFLFDLFVICILLFFKKNIEEVVKIFYVRKNEYEKEMGKFEAIHESVQTVLLEVEHMKSAVSLEEKRRHDWIESRNLKLINLIRYSEIINIGKTRLLTALNNESKPDLVKLQTDINEAIVNLRVDILTLMAINPEIKDNAVNIFADAVFLLGSEIQVRITNAISLLESSERMMNYALTLSDSKEKLSWMQKALDNKEELKRMKNDSNYEGHKEFEEKETHFITYMRKIFGDGTVLKMDMENNADV